MAGGKRLLTSGTAANEHQHWPLILRSLAEFANRLVVLKQQVCVLLKLRVIRTITISQGKFYR